MTDNRKSGLALIVGSLAGIIIMVLHPTGHDLFGSDHLESAVRMMIAVHGVALASLPVLFLGAWGLSLHLEKGDRVAIAALVTYAFGLLALMNAAVADGLIGPVLAKHMAAAEPSSRDMWHMLSFFDFRMNQGFAQVYVVASSIAIALWSISILKSHVFARGVAIYGVILAPITLLGLFSGHLQLDVHGFGMLILCQTIWFVKVGMLLYQTEKTSFPSVLP